MKQKTLFLLNFHPFVTRNILDAGVLERFTSECRVILLVLDHKKEYFEEVYGHLPNLTICGIPFEAISNEKPSFYFFRFADLLLDTNVKRYHKMERAEKTKKRARYIIETAITKLLGHSRLFKSLFRWLDYTFSQTTAYDHLFATYKPDMVFATDVYDTANALMLYRARKKRVPTYGMTRSWDNTTTKTYLRALPDILLTQNEFMREELVRLHDVGERNITPVGVPQFDEYLTYKAGSREVFCKEMGLDPAKRIILVCPASGIFVDTDWQILTILKRLYEEGKIPRDVQFLVRPHPYNDTDYSKFEAHPAFIFESNLTVYKNDRSKEREEGKMNRMHLTETLSHIDLMINTFSSIIVDAVICDKPVISIGFDGWEKEVLFHRSLARWQTEECVLYFFSHGATPIVRNEAELEGWIVRYLSDKTINAKEREAFKKIHMWKLDGKSAERIVQTVTSSKNN